MYFNEHVNCNTCKYGYFEEFSLDGLHNMCGAYKCYLCAQSQRSCDKYEEGDIPEGKEDI